MRKLRIGILGLRRGLTHLRNLMQVEEAHVIGCADRIQERRQRAAEAIAPDAVPMLEEFDALLETGPDAVVVASNGRCQAAHAVQALEAGCHVFSDVPGAFTEREVLDIVAAVKRTGKEYMLAENLCFLDFLRYWRKWIVEDRFGPISIAEGEYLHYLPRTMVDANGKTWTPTEPGRAGSTQWP